MRRSPRNRLGTDGRRRGSSSPNRSREAPVVERLEWDFRHDDRFGLGVPVTVHREPELAEHLVLMPLSAPLGRLGGVTVAEFPTRPLARARHSPNSFRALASQLG